MDLTRTGLAQIGRPAMAETEAALHGAERQLAEASERILRQPAGKLAIVLHLSRLPSPRSYHVRVARVLLQDTAHRFGGQVFSLGNDDLVLLCADGAAEARGRPGTKAAAALVDAPAASPNAPTGLPARLAELFSIDAPPGLVLTSCWHLAEEPGRLAAYLAEAAVRPAAPAPAIALRDQPVSLAALQEIVAHAPMAGLMVRQVGLSLSTERSLPLAARLSAAYQEITFGLDGLSLDPLISHALADPFLFRHFAQALDRRLIGLLQDDLARRGRLLRSATALRQPVLIELGLHAIVSPDFAALSRMASALGVRFWVAVSLLEAGTEPDLLDHARGLLKLTGCSLVIDRIDPAALGLVRLETLQPDLVKLPWTPRLRQAVQDGFAPGARVILQDVDGERGLAWGQAQGIGLFQGRFLDQVQAAGRMQLCHSAPGCTLRQCCSRAAALGPARAGCANPALLDQGFGQGVGQEFGRGAGHVPGRIAPARHGFAAPQL